MRPTELDTDACWARLEGESFGRLGVSTDTGVDIFPINYSVHDRQLFIRSAPGSKLMHIALHPRVAFEVDGIHAGMHWSVVVKGEATRLMSDDEIEESGVLELHTATPTGKWNFVRIRPTSVTGRQFSLLEELSDE